MNNITISNVTISQTESLFSLADLHKASGGQAKHQPALWLRNQQTQDLIAEIEAQGKQAVQTVNGGSKRGTYVCRELVVSYGMWISAKFALEVIQAFLNFHDNYILHLDRWLNEWERDQIRAAVKARCERTEESSQAVYRKLHAFMNLPSYEQISATQFQTALNFLASMENAPTLFSEPQGILITEEQIYQLSTLTRYARQMSELYRHLHPALRRLGSAYSGEAGSWAEVPHYWVCKMQDFLHQAFQQMHNPKHIEGVKANFALMS